jgi:hypothetical protein
MEPHGIEQLLDHKFWNQNNNDTQDSNQYYKKYEILKKEKATPRNKTKPVKKSNIQFIPNNNYDYSADTEEFGFPSALNDENVDENTQNNQISLNSNLINKITSIKPKTNDITNIDKQSINYMSSNRVNTMNYERIEFNNKNSTTNLENDDGFIYPGSFTATTYMNTINTIHPPRMFGPPTPLKQIPRIDLNAIGIGSNQLGYEMFNNSSRNRNNIIPNANSYSNFPVIQRGSFISKSTHYSSENKNKQGNGMDNDISVDLIDSSINEE